MKTQTTLLTLLSCFGLLTSGYGSILLISESFGGDGTGNLNGTTADVFDNGITTAGGSDVWVARTDKVAFRDNGSAGVSGGTTAENSAAFLNLGSYINDAKGTPTGQFTFEVTLTKPSADWASFGLFNGSQSVSWTFAAPESNGLANAIYRASENVAYFGGLGSGNGSGDSPYADPSVTFTTVLDLTTHDDATDFGSVSFFKNGSTSADFTFDYTSDQTFERIGFSILRGASTTYSDFTLTQIPEPSSFGFLAGIASAMAILVFRRRRA